MKRLLLTCAALIIFTATAFAYKVGDIIMVGGEMGVVFAVTTDGQHGKAMSISQTTCSWERAKTWCAQYGRGWRLPKIDELKIIHNKKNSSFCVRNRAWRMLLESCCAAKDGFAGKLY